MPKRFEDKVAIVTGAGCVGPGWGNGRAIAYGLATEGAVVIGVDRDPASMTETAERIAAEGGRFEAATLDVRDGAAIARLATEVAERHGRIDVLVNNVGGSASGGPVEMAEEVWDLQVDVNLKSVFLTLKHVLPVMEAQGGGAVVNLASTSGIRWTGAAQVAYAASKAGVIQLSRVVAVQYAAKGIRVNTVVPGQMRPPMASSRPGLPTGALPNLTVSISISLPICGGWWRDRQGGRGRARRGSRPIWKQSQRCSGM